MDSINPLVKLPSNSTSMDGLLNKSINNVQDFVNAMKTNNEQIPEKQRISFFREFLTNRKFTQTELTDLDKLICDLNYLKSFSEKSVEKVEFIHAYLTYLINSFQYEHLSNVLGTLQANPFLSHTLAYSSIDDTYYSADIGPELLEKIKKLVLDLKKPTIDPKDLSELVVVLYLALLHTGYPLTNMTNELFMDVLYILEKNGKKEIIFDLISYSSTDRKQFLKEYVFTRGLILMNDCAKKHGVNTANIAEEIKILYAISPEPPTSCSLYNTSLKLDLFTATDDRSGPITDVMLLLLTNGLRNETAFVVSACLKSQPLMTLFVNLVLSGTTLALLPKEKQMVLDEIKRQGGSQAFLCQLITTQNCKVLVSIYKLNKENVPKEVMPALDEAIYTEAKKIVPAISSQSDRDTSGLKQLLKDLKQTCNDLGLFTVKMSIDALEYQKLLRN